MTDTSKASKYLKTLMETMKAFHAEVESFPKETQYDYLTKNAVTCCVLSEQDQKGGQLILGNAGICDAMIDELVAANNELNKSRKGKKGMIELLHALLENESCN